MLTLLNWDWRPAILDRSLERAAFIPEPGEDWEDVDWLFVTDGGVLSPAAFRETFGTLPRFPDWATTGAQAGSSRAAAAE